jgi:glutamate transport system substrate-binding protein
MAEPHGGGRSAPLSRRPWPARRRAVPDEGTVEDIAVRDLAGDPPPDTPPPLPGTPPLLPDTPPPLPGTPPLLPGTPPLIHDMPPAPRFNLAPIRLAALGLALVLTIVIALVKLFVGGPPSIEDLRAQSGVDSWPVLTVGVKDDQPGVAYHNPDGSWTGFDIDIAYMIAEDLGFRRDEVKFYGIESEDRARMQATQMVGQEKQRVPVKMVIASYSITPAREAMAGVMFSAPYLYTEQSVITLKGHQPVAALEDLRKQRVCTLSTSTSQVLSPDPDRPTVIRKNLVSDCFKLLDDRRVDAVTTDAAILAGYEARSPGKYDHWDLGLDATEAWGVNVGDNPALKKLVDLTLYRSYKDPKDNRWELAYQNTLQAEIPDNRGTPIAVAEQPVVERPDVRVLPWETLTS